MSTSETIDIKVSRYDQEILFKVKPNLVSSEDNLGNKVKKRIIGIKLSPYNNKINHIKLGPAKALYHSVNEVYFVTTSTLKYLGAMMIGDVPGVEVRDDKVSITLSFSDGSFGTIHYFANGGKAFPKERIEVFCRDAVLQMNNYRVFLKQ